MRILIADDDPFTSKLMAKVVKNLGYECIVVHRAQEALKLLQSENAPKMALIDWVMPEMTGVELCKKVREDKQYCYKYLILVTSKDLKEDIIKGMDAGADDYVTKPFLSQELAVRINAGKRILDLQDQLTYLATHDVLTGILNRRAILKKLKQEMCRSKRNPFSIGIVMADLDHFKKVNDTYGHVAGDMVLVEASKILKSCLREYDEVGRYGGEEFVVVLPGADAQQSAVIANRMCEALAKSEILYGEHTLKVTSSFGVFAINGDCDPEKIDDYFRTVDKALYEAKEEGRNRVKIAGI